MQFKPLGLVRQVNGKPDTNCLADPAWPPALPNWQRGMVDEDLNVDQPSRLYIPPRRTSVTAFATIVIIAVIFAVSCNRSSRPSGPADIALAPGQVKLSFNDLDQPYQLAANDVGGVYVIDRQGGRIQELKPGSTTPKKLPFPKLGDIPEDLAVSSGGDVYAISGGDGKNVLKLARGTAQPVTLALGDMQWPGGVAVDSSDNVYVIDSDASVLLKLAVGSSQPTRTLINGKLGGMRANLAVDAEGNLYSAVHDSVVKLPPGSTTPIVLPLPRPASKENNFYADVAVGPGGMVYISQSNHNVILKYDPKTGAITEIPFAGQDAYGGVAVDKSGAVYVADYAGNRVSRLVVP